MSRVLDHLREQIVTGTIRPGARLREREVTDELGVSRIPVREAFLRLEAEGFVQNVPRRGAVVTGFSQREVSELFDVRCALEVLAARSAAHQVAAGASTAELEDALQAAEDTLQTGDDTRMVQCSMGIHDAITRLADNHLLEQISLPVNGRSRRLFHLTAERSRYTLHEEHKELCGAISQGNVELSGHLAFAHVELGRQPSIEILRQRAEDAASRAHRAHLLRGGATRRVVR